MGTISVGGTIRIPCEVKPGPFSDERLISFETIDGVVSGFVEESSLQKDGDNFFISGVVKALEPDAIVVLVRGDFFQTNGIATVARSVACAV
jgi:hypothetical protein